MPLDVYIDHNVWDFLFERGLDLSVELPREEFCLCLTREAEFEIPPTPHEKRKFIEDTIQKCGIETRAYFGFFDEQHSFNEQRVEGLDAGYLASEEEIAFMDAQESKLSKSKRPKTRLYKNEADISIAARSFNSIVLTLDKKPGPINDACRQGGAVIFLNDFSSTGLSLKEFIKVKVAGL